MVCGCRYRVQEGVVVVWCEGAAIDTGRREGASPGCSEGADKGWCEGVFMLQ